MMSWVTNMATIAQIHALQVQDKFMKIQRTTNFTNIPKE